MTVIKEALTIDNFANMEPMRYYDNSEPKTLGAIQKREDMIENAGGQYIATEKHDGDFGMFIHYGRGHNLIRSRSISKVTGMYGDLTDKLPHLAAEMDDWPDETVVLAEICWDKYGTNANTVGTILRCLPEKAVARQKDEKLRGLAFDLLMVGGEDLTNRSYSERAAHCKEFMQGGNFFRMTQIFEENFLEAADDIIAAGGEGVVIQRKDNPYMPGTRAAWKTLKLKQSMPHLELTVVDTIEPNKLYAGECAGSWPYHVVEDGVVVKVTKPYAMGWKNGVVVAYGAVRVEVTSGLTDLDREWLATEEARKMIAAGELCAEVKAMSENSQGSLRHPVLVRLRNDM